MVLGVNDQLIIGITFKEKLIRSFSLSPVSQAVQGKTLTLTRDLCKQYH